MKMKVNSISSTNFGAGINIKSAENQHRRFLYNDIEAIRKEFKIPANFRTHEVELPSVSKEILKKLKDLEIKFSNK